MATLSKPLKSKLPKKEPKNIVYGGDYLLTGKMGLIGGQMRGGLKSGFMLLNLLLLFAPMKMMILMKKMKLS